MTNEIIMAFIGGYTTFAVLENLNKGKYGLDTISLAIIAIASVYTAL